MSSPAPSAAVSETIARTAEKTAFLSGDDAEDDDEEVNAPATYCESGAARNRPAMTHTGPSNPERSFGVSVGIVLCAIAALLVWRGRVGRAEVVGGVGVFLLVFGLVYPPLLKYPSAAWWRFAQALGYVN